MRRESVGAAAGPAHGMMRVLCSGEDSTGGPAGRGGAPFPQRPFCGTIEGPGRRQGGPAAADPQGGPSLAFSYGAVEMKDETLEVEGMHCEGCENRIRRSLGALPGVARVEPDRRARRVSIRYEEAQLGLGELKERLERIGFEVL